MPVVVGSRVGVVRCAPLKLSKKRYGLLLLIELEVGIPFLELNLSPYVGGKGLALELRKVGYSLLIAKLLVVELGDLKTGGIGPKRRGVAIQKPLEQEYGIGPPQSCSAHRMEIGCIGTL